SSRISGETTEQLPIEANTETRPTKKSRMVEPVETDTHPVNFTSVDNQNASTTQTQSGDSSLPHQNAVDYQPQDTSTWTQQGSLKK
ncbi:2462_t:CDS:2, partial [Dentiscutata erythropus]